MKSFGRSVTVVVASAAMAAGILTSPAIAATPQPPKELGNVREWGMVAITVDSSSRVAAQTIEDVGGGSWTYGTELVTGGKRCYSYYFHGTEQHKSTAKIASGETMATALAGKTSKASRTAGAAYTCYAYWGKI
ncbi:lactococcin 972 family bacteriocin [Streptomyces sp. ME08-AFT2]|uniref:lactococcin 972 family bacteriocin n=1 Tax=Streptomyces sp. ME08-AFT2 TaxID=3028683 RepID=UPI0029A8134D|nr:lactococcin 972 family bacteriocin [Streptomyces sp. ME08-AFT2]MDX3308877.1 lactococcin 972 family bacteriocin [Streptomyces sp. ME08-AFT2]